MFLLFKIVYPHVDSVILFGLVLAHSELFIRIISGFSNDSPLLPIFIFLVFRAVISNIRIRNYLYENNTKELDDQDSEELDPNFRIPYYTDSETEDEFLGDDVRETSEFNTDPDIDMEWELYKILHAPPGPVPFDQIYLTFTCQLTDCYVKAIVDGNHSLIHILTYEKLWGWIESDCITCIDKARRALRDGGCEVPFAMDLEYDANSESEDVEGNEDVRRRRKKLRRRF